MTDLEELFYDWDRMCYLMVDGNGLARYSKTAHDIHKANKHLVHSVLDNEGCVVNGCIRLTYD